MIDYSVMSALTLQQILYSAVTNKRLGYHWVAARQWHITLKVYLQLDNIKCTIETFAFEKYQDFQTRVRGDSVTGNDTIQ